MVGAACERAFAALGLCRSRAGSSIRTRGCEADRRSADEPASHRALIAESQDELRERRCAAVVLVRAVEIDFRHAVAWKGRERHVPQRLSRPSDGTARPLRTQPQPDQTVSGRLQQAVQEYVPGELVVAHLDR